MEERVESQSWELVHGAGAAAPAAVVDAFLGIEGESTGAVKPDYFSLDSEIRYSRRALSDGDGEGDSLPDSDNPSWIDPESDSRFLVESSNLSGFWTSDESPRGDFDETWDFDGVAEASEESGDLSSENSPISEESSESLEEVNSRGLNLGGKPGTRWWKLPVEILKFCVFRIKPVWSISFAAALVGLVILKKTLYKKKPKIKSIPINLNLEDKASQFLIRASKINEAFSVVKRVPMIRSTVPSIGLSPFPLVALR